MRQRVITAVAILAVILVIALINNIYLTGFFISIINILAMYEAKKLFQVEDNVFYFLSVLAVLSIFTNPIFIAVVGVLGVSGYVAYYQKDLKEISISLYPFLPILIIFSLYLKLGMEILGWLIVIVALTDSFAYIVGKNFGRKFFNKGFSPTSPNKSIEGVLGGVFVGSIIGSIVGLYFYNFFESFIIALSVSIISVFGDLFESLLKRRAGIKDSGNILPGHGGILDRIDAYLFAAPLMWAFVFSLGN
jgi:phosphatidate cytidylyltransferase